MLKALEFETILERLRETHPGVHCLTNFVTAGDVANVLLAVGAAAIMAQAPEEMEEITAITRGTLLNTGTPDADKWTACEIAGAAANRRLHPVVLDPVGIGASTFREQGIRRLLAQVHPQLIRCNQEEAGILMGESIEQSGGVESSIRETGERAAALASQVAEKFQCTVLLSGAADVVTDGTRTALVHGGDPRISRLTGSGCMLSALCTAFLAADDGANLRNTRSRQQHPSDFERVLAASVLWKTSAKLAGEKTDACGEGMGSYHRNLMDAVSLLSGNEWKGRIDIEDRS